VGISVGIVGTGSFAHHFIPLFKAHPLVDEVILVDLDPEKLRRASVEFGVARTYPSLDALCNQPADAVALFTQNWLHAPQAIQALRAGMHVYSAVPTGITVDEIRELLQTVEKTRLVYMLGETSYYYPAVLYCRERHRRGDFGHVVYAEAEYYHDFDHGLYDVMKWRGGETWREIAGIPPMYYPTHTTSQIISITDAQMTHVSCQGFIDRDDDGLFGSTANLWGNPFSNESALFRMSDGSSCRINEFRRIGHPETVRMTMFGTEASFESNSAGSSWLTKDRSHQERLDDLLVHREVETSRGTFRNVTPLHPIDRLPPTFANLPSGHAGSHQFLVDDFVHACLDRAIPPNNIWMAARYAIPGLVAHESAMQGGQLREIPDLGDPPNGRTVAH
jgi:predicted dehydrogenase